MKTIGKIIAAGLMALTLIAGGLTGCQAPGVSQEQYDNVVSERDQLQKQVEEYQKNSGSGSPDASNPETSNPEEDPSSQETEPQVLVEKDGVKITYTGLGNSYLGTTIKLKIENNSEHDIMVQQRNMSINGIMLDGIFSSDVAKGKAANDSIDILSSKLKDNDIKEIEKAELSLLVIDSGSMDQLFQTDPIVIQVK